MNTVEITAHRGSSSKAPENTLAAFRQAIADGADWIELDVQTCADANVVIVHDRDLVRVADDPRRVEDLARDELRAIDVGRSFSAKFRGEQVPTLSEAIDLVRGRVRLNIELKYNRPDPLLAPAVLNILRTAHFLDHCVITSLDHRAIQEFKAAEPAARVGPVVIEPLTTFPEQAPDLLSMAADTVTPSLVQEAHRRGSTVHVWTVNEPEAMRHLIRTGVDNLITDKPDLLRSVLAEYA